MIMRVRGFGGSDRGALISQGIAELAGPGDAVIASAVGQRVALTVGRFLGGALGVWGYTALDLVSWHTSTGYHRYPVAGYLCLAAAAALNLPWPGMEVSCVVAVTRSQVLCCGLRSRLYGGSPLTLPLLRAPRQSVTAKAGLRWPLGMVVRISAPGQPRQLLMFPRAGSPGQDRLIAALREPDPPG